MGLLKSRPALFATLLLALHAVVVYAVARQEKPPPHRPLKEFPAEIGDWHLLQEGVVEKEIQDVLLADDTLVRTYRNSDGSAAAGLFIAYFRTQRTGVNPHSPKHCMPGTGWIPTETSVIPVSIPGRQEPVYVNRFLVAKGPEKSIVLYWFQGRNRVVASEYAARLYLIADSVRYNRSDTSLVRIIVPVVNDDADAGTERAKQFAQACFPWLGKFLPD